MASGQREPAEHITNDLSERRGSRGPPGKLERLQVFIVEEFDGLLIVLGALAAGSASVFSSLEALTAPAVATIVLAMGLRIFRVRYQLADVEESMSQRVDASVKAVAGQVSEIGLSITSLRSTVVSDRMHEAERCDRTRFYFHMLGALESASRSVDLTQLDSRAPKHYGTPEMVTYFNRQAEVVRERPSVKFRRIVAVPTLDKLGWTLDVIEQTRSCPNFQINVIDISKSGGLPPPLSLQIFDRRQMCLVDPTLGYMLPEDQQNMLWIKGSAVAEVFSIYYDSIWRLSQRIKEGSLVYWNVLETLLHELRAQHPDDADLAGELEDRLHTMSGRRKA